MLSENELSAFFGFSDTSECMLMFFYASLMWTTPHVSSTYLEQSRLHAWKMQVSPRETQYSMLFEDAVIMSFNIPITSHIIYYRIMWRRLQKLFDNFRNGGLWRMGAGNWKNQKKNQKIFKKFSKNFQKIFKKF